MAKVPTTPYLDPEDSSPTRATIRQSGSVNATALIGPHPAPQPYFVAAQLCYPIQIPNQIPEPVSTPHMHTFTSFDGTRIAYSDEGDGPAVILLHGFGVDALGQFGEFERILPGLEKRQAWGTTPVRVAHASKAG